MRTHAQRRSAIPAAAALLLAALLATACKPAPSEAELKARDEAIARSVQQALDEDRSKDRQLREQARADAHRMMPADTSADATRGDAGAAQDAMATVASARAAIEARDSAPFIERIKRALLNPDTMETRDASLRENGTAFCAEVNMKKRSGAMSGFTPVIVTADRVLFHLGAMDALDPRETIDPAEFLKLNLQLRCWIVAAPGK